METQELVPPTILCPDILLRLAAYDNYVGRDGRFTPKAFFLRRESATRPKETSLSLIIRDSCTLWEAFKTVLTQPCYGMASLHTGRILDLNLLPPVLDNGIHLEVEGEIKADDPTRQIYACLKNLPHKDDDVKGAQLMADLLSEMARPIPLEEIEATAPGPESES